MLSTNEKRRPPDWTHGYNPTWEEGQWIVIFPGPNAADTGLEDMRYVKGAPRLAMAEYPGGGNNWYVGEA